MKDERGLFYYPFPQNRRVRMYVREQEGDIWFRIWNEDDPKLWDDHGWVPHGAIQRATDMYQPKTTDPFNPKRAYDVEVAKMILKEGRTSPG